LEDITGWIQGLVVGEPIALLIAVQLATLALSLTAILVWRFRYREKVVYVRDMAGVDASEAAEDLSSAMLVVFTDQGRVVAASGIEGEAVAPFVREALSHLAELGMERVAEMRVWGEQRRHDGREGLGGRREGRLRRRHKAGRQAARGQEREGRGREAVRRPR
jgi:hypothetical protein